MGGLLAIAAALGAIGFAAWPLLHSRPAESTQGAMAELLGQRERALNDIRELDFDRELGNLDEADHRELLEQSKRRAVAVLRQLQQQDQRIDDEIEQAIRGLREGGSADR